jgi:hypothetical protein
MAETSTSHPFLDAGLSLPGRIVVSWPLAGGLVAGGFLVATTAFNGGGVPQMTTLLFVLGAGAGLAHGLLLGYLCHDPARTRLQVLQTMIRAAIWVPPGLVLAWVAAMWISLTRDVVAESSAMGMGVVWLGLSWIFGVVVLTWAGVAGFQGAWAALHRWPHVRIAAVVTSVAFGILLTWFLTSPPEIWFTDLRVTSIGAVLLAFGASVWIALPVAIGTLELVHKIRHPNA